MIGVAAGDCEVVVLSSDDECQKKQLQEDWIPFEDLKEPFPEESDSDSQERKSRKKLKRKSKSVEEDDRRQRRQEKLLEARENKETTDSDSLTLLSQPPRKKKKEKHLVPKLIQTNQKVLKKKKKLKVVAQEEADKKMTPQERDAAAASSKVKKKKKQTKPSPCPAKDGSLPQGRPSFVPDSIFLETDYVYGFSEKDARDWWESSPDRGHSFSLENILEEITTSLVPVLRQGLRQRVKSIVGPKLLKAASDGSSYVVLGLVVDEDHCYDVIDKVEAGTAEAKDFVELWGQTELRRFADGQLFECVLWGESTYTHHQRRRIVHAIVREYKRPTRSPS
ncbi:unnamed protein product [Cyprideis torosa]|uniref:Nucleolar protein 6 n=1 Tax=Cyprideis torosa TaxID=163714 RepID=A0A7R8WDN7_9CRUS|nr:unnamed protein product [Cyprideis torosa]CAG0893391.1 unnamed protein product [Cyprideis torosa]